MEVVRGPEWNVVVSVVPVSKAVSRLLSISYMVLYDSDWNKNGWSRGPTSTR